MKVGRVAIITRGRYAGKKVRHEMIPFSVSARGGLCVMAFVLARANKFETTKNYDTLNDIQRELDGRKIACYGFQG